MNQDTPPLTDDTARPPRGQSSRRLHALGRVGLHADACIAGRIGADDCRRCVEACPHASLSRVNGDLTLDPIACSGCGLCAAACPSGALAVEGFALPARVPATGMLLQCERAHCATGQAAHRVPCLGGLALDDWLRLALAAGGVPLRVQDDGACRGCGNAVGTCVPWAATLGIARRALSEAGVPAEALPARVEGTALPNGNRCAQTTNGEAVASRRRFFAGVSRSLASALTQAASADASSRAPRVAAPRRRSGAAGRRSDETRLLLLRIAQRHGLPHPRSVLLPTLAANHACRADGACARICPTGALQLESGADGRRAELRFEAWRCVECGACVQLCPAHALSLSARDWGAFAEAPAVLATTEQSECLRCGALFAATEDETLCERCLKAERLARAGFALHGRHHGETPASPEGP